MSRQSGQEKLKTSTTDLGERLTALQQRLNTQAEELSGAIRAAQTTIKAEVAKNLGENNDSLRRCVVDIQNASSKPLFRMYLSISNPYVHTHHHTHSAMTDLEARFEAVVARLAAMQDAAKVQQAALSSLPTRVDALQHDLRKQNNKLSSRIDEDLTSLGQEIAMVKVCVGIFLKTPFF